MYHIVEFIETSEVEVVPSLWVQNGACAWPSYKSVAKIHKAVALQESPHHSWPTFRVRIFYTTETYEEARLKLPKAEEGKEEDDSRPSYTKRKNRGLKRHDYSDSDEDCSGRKRVGKTVKTEDLSEITAAPQVPSPPPPMTSTPSRTPSRFTDDTVRSSAPRNLYSPCSSAIGNQDRTCCNSSCLSMLSELIKSQEIMKQQLVLILKNQQMQNSSTLQRDEIPDVSEFNLPLTDSSGLERLETQLKEQPEQMKKLVAYFGITGGFSTKEAVWRIMGKLLINSLAKRINWSGANQKVSFRELALRTVVVNAVRTNVHTKSATEKEVEKYITRWLQLAPDRDGGRKEKDKGNSL